MDFAAIIAEQIPLLQSLHSELALPESALTDDMARIDAAVKAAILSIVRSREDEVAEWEAKIAEDKRILAGLARAVGDQGRSVLAAGRRESERGETLPAHHERLLRQSEELEQVYNERLIKIEELIAHVERLSILLGPPFEPPEPLHPIAGCALVANRAPRQSMLAPPPAVPSQHLAAPTTSSSRRPSMLRAMAAAPPPQPEPKVESWMDVGEEVMDALQKQLDRAMEERDNRIGKLERHFVDLVWFRFELQLPDLLDTSFPVYLLPSRDLEETPGAHARYEKILAQILALNPWKGANEEDEGDVELQGMDDIEPEIGLINWCEQLLELWMVEKDDRDARIQELYEQIEPLWTRLEVPKEEIDAFMESNRGSGLRNIQAYVDELQRVTEIRKASLSDFVLKTRKEIEALQEGLMMSEEEKAEFGDFIDDNYTEELLERHEEEAARLRAEVELRGKMLPKVKEWISIKAEEEELERSAQDPNRFKKRGTAMLREEKMRKRVEKLKPKIEGELLQALPPWEEEHGRPFLAFGERVIDTIQNAIAAKEAAKEAKKRAKAGLGPAPVPAATSRSQPNTVRKRVGPTPHAAPSTAGVKRQRVVSSASTSSATSNGPPRARQRLVSPSNFETPTPKYGARGPTRMFGQPAVGVQANGARPTPHLSIPRSQVTSSTASQSAAKARQGVAHLSKGEGRRPRKSFRPRQSLAAGMLTGRLNLPADLVEEDEDVF